MKRIVKVLFLVLVIIYINLVIKNVNANENNLYLYEQTNTYECYQNEDGDVIYNLDKKNNISVSNGEPTVTVFTHGLGGDASHWSNNGNKKLEYNKYSLISKMANLCDCIIINAFYYNNVKLTFRDYTGVFYGNKNYFEIDNLNDISKHILLIFKASKNATNSSNKDVYDEFNYMMSKFLYDYKQLNNGVLPKINLIGHSRGGLTNLQYAMDHPDLVDSIYSLATPYCGSTSAEINKCFNFLPAGDGQDDIINYDIYSKMLNFWNTNYDKYYSKINVLALGGYSSPEFFSDCLEAKTSIGYFLENEENKKYFKLLSYGIKIYSEMRKITDNILVTELFRQISDYAKAYSIDIGIIDDFVNVLCSQINYNSYLNQVDICNDLLVDLPSQLGMMGGIKNPILWYKGFKKFAKRFDKNNTDFNNVSDSGMPAVVHNIEIFDSTLQNEILKDIKLGYGTYKNDYIYDEINGELEIIGYYGSDKEIIVPKYIDGKLVTRIGVNAFANNKKIERISLPDSIVELKYGSFENCSNLVSINVNDLSNLRSVCDNSFYMCEALSEAYNDKYQLFPDNVEYLGNDVLNGTNVKRIKLPANLKTIKN